MVKGWFFFFARVFDTNYVVVVVQVSRRFNYAWYKLHRAIYGHRIWKIYCTGNVTFQEPGSTRNSAVVRYLLQSVSSSF